MRLLPRQGRGGDQAVLVAPGRGPLGRPTGQAGAGDHARVRAGEPDGRRGEAHRRVDARRVLLAGRARRYQAPARGTGAPHRRAVPQHGGRPARVVLVGTRLGQGRSGLARPVFQRPRLGRQEAQARAHRPRRVVRLRRQAPGRRRGRRRVLPPLGRQRRPARDRRVRVRRPQQPRRGTLGQRPEDSHHRRARAVGVGDDAPRQCGPQRRPAVPGQARVLQGQARRAGQSRARQARAGVRASGVEAPRPAHRGAGRGALPAPAQLPGALRRNDRVPARRQVARLGARHHDLQSLRPGADRQRPRRVGLRRQAPQPLRRHQRRRQGPRREGEEIRPYFC